MAAVQSIVRNCSPPFRTALSIRSISTPYVITIFLPILTTFSLFCPQLKVRLLISMFDRSGKGSINFEEFTSFGYRFSEQFYETLFLKFKQRVNFDDFIQICVHLQSLTAEFRKLDTDLDGVITIPYEHFVSLVFKIVINK